MNDFILIKQYNIELKFDGIAIQLIIVSCDLEELPIKYYLNVNGIYIFPIQLLNG
jgi:hypothetical protein